MGDEQGWLFSGRVSLGAFGWLADHRVGDVVVVPGAAVVEMVLAAGACAGLRCVDELVLHVPVLIPAETALDLQLLIGASGPDGRCEVRLFSRPADSVGDDGGLATSGSWVRHASATLSAGADVAVGGAQSLSVWPPVDAVAVAVDSLYDRLGGVGLHYGPAFQGVRAMWRRGEQVFAEVAVDEHQPVEGFALHPVLLDAALHAAADLHGGIDGAAGQVVLPFAWTKVVLASPSAGDVSVLRVVLGRTDSGLWLHAADESGVPVLDVGQLVVRPVDIGALARAGGGGHAQSLHAVRFTAVPVAAGAPAPAVAVVGDVGGLGTDTAAGYRDLGALIEAIGAGAPAPQVVLASAPLNTDTGADLITATRTGLYATLDLVQRWLRAPEVATSRLVLISQGAVAAGDGEIPDLGAAPAQGLWRSLANEHPGRFGWLDIDDSAASAEALSAALGLGAEPTLALRDGILLAPRLTHASLPASTSTPAFDPDTTVLITGGTGALGMALARHLASTHHCRHLLLLSRRGAAAEGAQELATELAELG